MVTDPVPRSLSAPGAVRSLDPFDPLNPFDPLVPLNALNPSLALPINSPVFKPVNDSFVAPVHLAIQPAIVPPVLLPPICPHRPAIRSATAFTLHFVSYETVVHAEFRPDTVAAAVKPFEADPLESRLPAQALDQLLTVGLAQCSNIETLDPRVQRSVFLALHPGFYLPAVDHTSKCHGPLHPVSRQRSTDVSQQVLIALDTQKQTPAFLHVERKVAELNLSGTLGESTGDGLSHLRQVYRAARRSG